MDLRSTCPVPARSDESFERFTRLVKAQLDVPVALVSFLWSEGQVFPGAIGLPEPWMTSRQTPLSHSFCQHVVVSERPLVIADARDEPLVANNLAIPDLGVVAYAGMPLVDAEGNVVGSLCAIDHQPRDWTHEDLAVLKDLANACSVQVQLRLAEEAAVASAARAQADAAFRRLLLSLSEALAAALTADEVARAVYGVAADGLNASWAAVLVPDGRRSRTLRCVEGAVLPRGGSRGMRAVPVDGEGLRVAGQMGPRFYLGEADMAADFPVLVGATRLPPGAVRAVIPLAVAARPTGFLLLGWAPSVELTDDVRSVATALGGYAAQALERARLLEERREVATALQEGMLTQVLPEYPGGQLAAFYRPSAQGEKVGGDWYDVLVTGGGDLVLTVGDVAGHDVHAAAAMGQLRSTMRAFVWDHDEPPSSSLSRLDSAISGLNLGTVASAVLARVGPRRDTAAGGVEDGLVLRWSNAGHPPPVLVTAAGTVDVLVTENDLLLGVQPGRDRTDHARGFARGDTLLLFTDGLIERRAQPHDRGLRLLAEWLAEHHAGPLDELVEACVHDLTGDEPSDDVAVLAIRMSASG